MGRSSRAVRVAGAVVLLAIAAIALRIELPKWSGAAGPRRPEAGVKRAGFSVAARGRQRKIYPFSVIPGGIATAAELQDRARQDPVVALHYRNFQFSRAVWRIAKHDRLAYVSYRKHDKIYWTRRPVLIHAGEHTVSDGEIEARERCGNQVSDRAKGPTSPEEPPELNEDGEAAREAARFKEAVHPNLAGQLAGPPILEDLLPGGSIASLGVLQIAAAPVSAVARSSSPLGTPSAASESGGFSTSMLSGNGLPIGFPLTGVQTPISWQPGLVAGAPSLLASGPTLPSGLSGAIFQNFGVAAPVRYVLTIVQNPAPAELGASAPNAGPTVSIVSTPPAPGFQPAPPASLSNPPGPAPPTSPNAPRPGTPPVDRPLLVTNTPEPSTILFAGIGLVCMSCGAVLGRRRKLGRSQPLR